MKQAKNILLLLGALTGVGLILWIIFKATHSTKKTNEPVGYTDSKSAYIDLAKTMITASAPIVHYYLRNK